MSEESNLPQYEKCVIHLKEVYAYGKDKVLSVNLKENKVGIGDLVILIVDNETKDTTYIPMNNVRSATMMTKQVIN